MRWKLIGLILFAVLVAAFTLSNSRLVEVNFLFVSVQMNLVLLMLITLLLGMCLMAILWSIRAWKWRGEMNRLRQQVAELTEQANVKRDEHVDEAKSPMSDPM
ncbi:lipopolysaccharide assembly protein LapA domain-containing protein [Effusibacillus dendaii]|uniref:Lipopolysaccharide assembly protein A domain-containing protein n=1 Tax=Effusibacillus dendaii TaxID=2743772 RepID=A0A7I8DAX5_9BACL|nr:LapA family protein [Effusibacillus dendaii]BCJ85061.1 hypothetical protein skT53_00460 [Effusibacillus dendaii]